ncbi:MAG: hypothetical protein EOP45_19115 [Sphingobacteriaceae bacterium]|nr:MAG: hypothetical protein EOP45_19115 [Sphingobacteriaceae bacterium]
MSTTDISFANGTVSLKVLGKSGNFRIANGTKFILFTLDRLQEVDTTGKKVQSVNPQVFKSALNWGPVTPDVMIPGSTVAATMVQLNSSFVLGKPGNDKTTTTTAPSNITFNLTVYIAKESGTYIFANSTFPVNANDVKYTISVSNWPFVSTTNMLQFGLTMRTNTTGSTGTNTVKTKTNPTSASIAVGGAIINAPLSAIIDDNVTNNVLTSTYGNGSGIQFNFPSFAKSLVYDPTIDTSGTTNISTYITPTTDSCGTTVVGGDTSLVTPDTTYVPLIVKEDTPIHYFK